MPHAQLPSLTGQELADQLVDWCFGKRSLEELKQLPWQQLIEQLLTHDQRRLLDQQAPSRCVCLPGETVLLQYEPDEPLCWPRAFKNCLAGAPRRGWPKAGSR